MRVMRLLGIGACRCCDGCGRTTARGTQRRVLLAARKGHLSVMQRAREDHCPWDEDTCASAVKGGHQRVLQRAANNDRQRTFIKT
jgi:hypothetical protein